MTKYLASITHGPNNYRHTTVGPLDDSDYEHFRDLGVPEGRLVSRGPVHNNSWTDQGIFDSEQSAKKALKS